MIYTDFKAKSGIDCVLGLSSYNELKELGEKSYILKIKEEKELIKDRVVIGGRYCS